VGLMFVFCQYSTRKQYTTEGRHTRCYRWRNKIDR